VPQHVRFGGCGPAFHHVHPDEDLNKRHSAWIQVLDEVCGRAGPTRNPIVAPNGCVDALRAHLAKSVARGEPRSLDQPLWSGDGGHTRSAFRRPCCPTGGRRSPAGTRSRSASLSSMPNRHRDPIRPPSSTPGSDYATHVVQHARRLITSGRARIQRARLHAKTQDSVGRKRR